MQIPRVASCVAEVETTVADAPGRSRRRARSADGSVTPKVELTSATRLTKSEEPSVRGARAGEGGCRVAERMVESKE